MLNMARVLMDAAIATVLEPEVEAPDTGELEEERSKEPAIVEAS
jgi:hypothetical protein